MVHNTARECLGFLVQERLHLIARDASEHLRSERGFQMEDHPGLSRHSSGLLPFPVAHRQEHLFEVNTEGIHGLLSLAGILVLRLEDHGHGRFGFALSHRGAAAQHLGLLPSVLPPLGDPDFVLAVFAGADASLLKSFLTHE